MMQGSIHARLGVTSGAVSQRRITRSLRIVAPRAQDARRRDALDRTNPIPYFNPYFGYKVHMDQNEKVSVKNVAKNGQSGVQRLRLIRFLANFHAHFEWVFGIFWATGKKNSMKLGQKQDKMDRE